MDMTSLFIIRSSNERLAGAGHGNSLLFQLLLDFSIKRNLN
jgi:hypothetical protein